MSPVGLVLEHAHEMKFENTSKATMLISTNPGTIHPEEVLQQSNWAEFIKAMEKELQDHIGKKNTGKWYTQKWYKAQETHTNGMVHEMQPKPHG